MVKDGSISIHHRNIHAVAIEMYKSKQGLSPELMKDIFVSRTHQDRALRSNSEFQVPKVKTVKNGHDSLRYFGTKVWNMMPNYIKSADSLEKFKIKIKQWTPNNCACRLCKPYIHRIGYVNID